MEGMDKLRRVLEECVDGMLIKRIVLSKPRDGDVLRAQIRPVMLKDGVYYQLERHMRGGKVYHVNTPAPKAVDAVLAEFEGYGQMNVVTSAGECQAANGKNGVKVLDRVRRDAQPQSPAAHDSGRNYIIPEAPTPFLEKLGVMDTSGRVFDARRAKYRQINRFLEYLADVVDRLPAADGICLYDLCCGKAYLTFAAYHYLKNVRGIARVRVFGVDLKQDVVAECAAIARELGFDGMSFACADIADVRPDSRVDVVMSLHACDTATDIVLAHAVKWGARAILSAPCCQHELAGQIKPDAMGGFLRQPLLRYRFAQLATDALRCQLLEACSYSVSATEFTDPDDTDKNLLIRAVRGRAVPEQKRRAILEDYNATAARFGFKPALAALLADRLAIQEKKND